MNKSLKIFLTGLLSIVILTAVILTAGCFRKSGDKSSKFSLRKPKEISELIESDCPISFSDNTEWTYFPPDNFMGLVAMGKDHDETDQMFIFVFSEDAMDDNAKEIFMDGDASSICFYGSYNFEDREVEEKDDYIYTKLKCDNRITVVDFCFQTETDSINEREIIKISDYEENELMELTFVHYDYNYPPKTDNTRKDIKYDFEKGAWGDYEDVVLESEPFSSIDYYRYTELQINEDYSSVVNEQYNTEVPVYMGVDRYDYIYPTYNIYKELTAPGEVKLSVMIGTTDNSDLWDQMDADAYLEENDIKLYLKSGDEYIDITPDTVEFEYGFGAQQKGDDGEFYDTYRGYYIHFIDLDELEEEVYKLEIGEFSFEFKLTVQTFEVW